jgi:RNase P/RNase MRP subunit p29
VDSYLEKEHDAFVRRIQPAVATLRGWIKAESVPEAELVDILDGKLARATPRTLRVATHPKAGKVLRAHEEITFEILDEDGQLYAGDDGVKWRADGEDVTVKGSPMLTHVFRARLFDWVPYVNVRTVEAWVGGVPVKPWRGPILRRPSSEVSRRRSEAAGVKLGATLVGACAASAAAVALYWADKPFGSSSDYLALLTTGLGVDVGVVGAGGKLLNGVVAYLTHQGEKRPAGEKDEPVEKKTKEES